MVKPGGGEGCQIAQPAQTALTLDGAQNRMLASRPGSLLRTGTDEGGGRIVLDEYALVLTDGSGSYLQQATEGFDASPAAMSSAVGKKPSPNAVDRQGVSFQAAAISSNATLLIQHQRAHPANHNFAHAPLITFTPQPMMGSSPQQGFAVLNFGKSGAVQRLRILPANGQDPSPQLLAAMRKLARTEFMDERRHDHTVYLAYAVLSGALYGVGPGVVTMPMCCPMPASSAGHTTRALLISVAHTLNTRLRADCPIEPSVRWHMPPGRARQLIHPPPCYCMGRWLDLMPQLQGTPD